MVFILKWQNSQPVIVCLNMYFSRNLRDYWYMGGGGGVCWTNTARWAVERSKLDEITFGLAQLVEFEWSLVSMRHSTKFPELDAKDNHRDCGIKESYWGLTYYHLHEENPLPDLFAVWLRNVCYVSWLRASKLLTFGWTTAAWSIRINITTCNNNFNEYKSFRGQVFTTEKIEQI